MSSLIGLVHGNEAYIEFEFRWDTLPVLLAAVPWIYMLPTLLLILRIHRVYLKSQNGKSDNLINRHLFRVLCWSQFTCYLFFVSDYLVIRLPATGLFTSWCARSDPNHYLKAVFFSTFYLNYMAMLLPLLLSLVRLLIIFFPNSHSRVNEHLLRIALPLVLIYPLLFTFFLIPALGVCKTMAFPYPFGSVVIFYIDSLWEMHQSHLYLWNTLFWLFCSIAVNSLLLAKLIRVKGGIQKASRSAQSHKGELSLTVTTAAMVLFYVTNLGFGFAYVMYDMSSNYNSWATMFRPFGNDLETAVVPLVFYVTHPVFRREDPKFFGWFFGRRKSSAGQRIVKISPSSSGSF